VEKESVATEAQIGLARRAVQHWRRAARAIGVVQTRFVMLLIYLIAVLPVGLVFRCRRDPLGLRRPSKSNWMPCPEEEQTLERARRQF